MTTHSLTEFDLFFISYDEPNAEKHWADLLTKAAWANRTHGVKGFDAAHRACAERSETDWFITVDADNIVMPEFFDETIELDATTRPNECFSWNGINMMNGLMYGNGGLKLWSKSFVLNGGVGHETSSNPMHAVDFCWQDDYKGINKCFSEVWNNGSAYQAYRVGFREGVKLTLDRGMRVAPEDMKRLHRTNIRNMRVWSSVGQDIVNGLWAMYGARQGWANMLDLDFDHVVVRDYDWFAEHWETVKDVSDIHAECLRLGRKIERATNMVIPLLDSEASEFFRDMFRWRNE